MEERILGVTAFMLLICIYTTVMFVFAQLLPFLFLAGLLAWVVIRRPIAHPERVDTDINTLSSKTGHTVGRLAEALIRPLTDGR